MGFKRKMQHHTSQKLNF